MSIADIMDPLGTSPFYSPFRVGMRHAIYSYDLLLNILAPVGSVRIVRVLDSFLLDVEALDTMVDANGDFHKAGDVFTAMLTPGPGAYLTFLPEDEEEWEDDDEEKTS